MEDPPKDASQRPEGPPPAATVDARGHRCPTPTLRLRRALERVGPGERVLLIADDPMARIDVPYFLAEAGAELLWSSDEGGRLQFLVEKR